jgi:hypothetical protein
MADGRIDIIVLIVQDNMQIVCVEEVDGIGIKQSRINNG